MHILLLTAAFFTTSAATRQPGPAEQATLAAIARIEALNPRLNAVTAIDPDAVAQARALDRQRRARGPLFGMPLLVKDNIETADSLPTTAGSLALHDNVTGRDAPLVARLRAAGAVIVGKASLSEWANIRSSRSISGWSAIGGQVRNPHALDRSPCGSSSGSAAAVAAGMVPAAIGTETDGSISCPAAMTGIVGLKPTVGLVSRTHIVPISHSQDTPGPMTRTVRDAALILSAIAGSDPADPATAQADAHRADYVAALRPDALRGQRIGVMRFATGFSPATDALFERALAQLRAAGAILVDISESGIDRRAIGDAEFTVLRTELKADLNAYLATTPPAVKSRTLADIIAFNAANAPAEMPLFAQESFLQAETTKGLSDPAYLQARETSRRLAAEGLDRLLADNKVVALIGPTATPAFPIDSVNGDRSGGSGGAGSLAAVSGYPHLTVPMGAVRGLPVGLSFIGPAWSEATLLALGHAYEQASRARIEPGFIDSIEAGADIAPFLRPQR
ncbi:amidase [Sphingomonas oleivorans]|uniref:Amidase n=1 Tax=Sphingomonas oleivorans TaxID=1735121 RepID=A0A2T5G395_9SPHN|nr:amidase [Sphingomonas oleivorans]